MTTGPTTVRLRDDVEVVVLEGRILVGVGGDTLEWDGPEAAVLARILERLAEGSDLDTVATGSGISRDELDQYLTELERRGCFVPDRLPGSRATGWPTGSSIGICGLDASAIYLVRRLLALGTSVSILDANRWSSLDAAAFPGTETFVDRPRVEAVRSLLGPTGSELVTFRPEAVWADGFPAWAGARSAVVTFTPTAAPATYERINAVLGEMEVPWFPVRSSLAATELGPAVRPPRAPCYDCYALRVLLNQTIVSSGRPPPGAPPPAGRPLSERAELTALWAIQLLRELGAPASEPTLSSVLRIEWATGRSTWSPVLPLPNCPGCDGWVGEPVRR